jgi:DNA-binding IclR family transcriptional regulator
VLQAFQPSDAQLTLAEITRRTGLPKTTVHRLLAELQQSGLIERTSDGVRLGMGLFELGQLVPRQRGLRESAMPFLNDLYEATRETVHLAVLEQHEVVYIAKITGRAAPAVPSRVGGRMPTYCTGVGKVLLAYAPPETRRAVLDGPLHRRTPYTIVMPGRLRRELAAVRRRGLAFENEESSLGIACVACAVFDQAGQAVAAVSIAGWVNRLDTTRVASAVRTAALGISRQLRAAS